MKLAKNKTSIAIAVCIFCIVGLWLYFFSSQPADTQPGQTQKAVMTVEVEHPQQQTLPQTITANGNIAAWHEAVIGSESQGLRLSEVRVNVGDQVNKGQVLATFAPELVQAELAQAEASLAEAQAAAAEAMINANRARKLDNTGALSASQVDQYLAAEKTTQARVEAGRAQVQLHRLRLSHTQVKAPDDGVISARTATVGSVVNAGTELFRLIRQGRLEWRAELTATEIPHIQPDMVVQITAASGTVVTGKVRITAPSVNEQTRNALVYVDILPTPEQQEGVKAGMFARGAFALGGTPALTVSQSAVVMRDGFKYLYAVGDDLHVIQLKIQTGRLYQDRFEILEGLPADARVVTRGASFLNHGDLVRIAETVPHIAPTMVPTTVPTAPPTTAPTPIPDKVSDTATGEKSGQESGQ